MRLQWPRRAFPVLFLITFLLAAAQSPEHTDKETLEAEKLQLEVDRLQREADQAEAQESRSRITSWVSISGGVAGVVAVIWAVFNGISAMRFRTESERSARISQLLESLSSESPTKRLGAARGLGRFARDVVPEVLSALATESASDVRNSLTSVLVRADRAALADVLEANRQTISARANSLGRARALGINEEQVQALFRLSADSLQRMRREHRAAYDQGKSATEKEMERSGILRQENDYLIRDLVNLVEQQVRICQGTAAVIAELARNGRIARRLWLGALDLTTTNLYAAPLSGFDLRGSTLVDAILRHARLDGSKLDGCVLESADLYDAHLDRSSMKKIVAVSAKFRDSRANHADLSQADLRAATLSGSTMDHVRLEGCNLRGGKMRRTTLRYAAAVNAKAGRVELQQATLDYGRWDRAELYGAELQEASARGTSFAGAKMNGADLRGANLTRADFTGATLDGAKVSGADFTGATTTDVDWTRVRGLDDAIGLELADASRSADSDD